MFAVRSMHLGAFVPRLIVSAFIAKPKAASVSATCSYTPAHTELPGSFHCVLLTRIRDRDSGATQRLAVADLSVSELGC